MEKAEFERIAQEVLDSLPVTLRDRIENVHIAVEDEPTAEMIERMGVTRHSKLLGLYEGIPLTRRGASYGSSPVVPDKITLFKWNIESFSVDDSSLREKIREVLIHEIGHYYGMTEEQVRNAGY